MSAEKMEEMATSIVIDLMHSGLSPHEGMVVLAQTLAVAFRTDNVPRKEAIKRFTQIVDNVYNDVN
jgi:hypothetical protein